MCVDLLYLISPPGTVWLSCCRPALPWWGWGRGRLGPPWCSHFLRMSWRHNETNNTEKLKRQAEISGKPKLNYSHYSHLTTATGFFTESVKAAEVSCSFIYCETMKHRNLSSCFLIRFKISKRMAIHINCHFKLRISNRQTYSECL